MARTLRRRQVGYISDYAYVIRIKNTGAFTPPPAITISYPTGTLHPLVTILPREGIAWHYTLDSTAPSPGSSLYTNPFTIPRSATLKVQGFQQDKLPGGLATIPQGKRWSHLYGLPESTG